EPGAGHGKGSVDFLIARDDVVWAGHFDGEERVFERRGAVEAPAIIGYGLDDGGFERSLRSERLADALTMVVIGEPIFLGEDVDLASESVTIGVEGAALARFGGGELILHE